ncbi:hypothetical protein COU19_03320 [Candidatus Kaiserbacteria bacterium CG10_big_fil_rev_8_21_14_0_10_56_12]|uniref:Dockerin domain-containing protein n=1 Tax=Candidatus Kaiserbacteria bacterium CG10_big_fil_rev_8_21_14_0_10_56_12 TaxID=1974611 RepID=A0A2H0U9A8_9BACT|nr:MAG: hypothetical protein COU19_03320 [Candidatus Kaiserbacteria bacterium CG10_big_fil_rev_8_21_14_0_10_56_12]
MAHDYNNDGSVDATDANYLLAVAVGSASCPSGKACDINNDGRVTASDALVLVKSVFDYTRDGSVTSADTSELLRVATGVISCPTGTLCDINRDGKVNTSDVLALQRMISGTVLGASCHTFTRNLALHMSGDDVAALQDALTQDGEAVENTGYFGPITSAAAKAFQEKYASEVLTPNNLTHGTGYVGVSTRNKLNQLYGCSV